MEHGWSLLASQNSSPQTNCAACPQIWDSWGEKKKPEVRAESPEGRGGSRGKPGYPGTAVQTLGMLGQLRLACVKG